MSQDRHLAAILFTDLVGYTALMQKDEEQAIDLIKRHRVVLETKVEEFHGKVIEYYGDGSLCIFSSVTDAVRCAIAVQHVLREKPAIPLRIGIHIGEIIREGDKIMGDGVNLASRIQSLGEAGSILVSREISDKIKNRTEFSLRSLGYVDLKNVDEPMEVFAVTNEGLTVPKLLQAKLIKVADTGERNFLVRYKWALVIALVFLGAAIVLGITLGQKERFSGTEKSIAVLPFENISNDPSQEYFSDGITEDIISQLSQIRGLKVISRTSVMQFKDSKKSLREIAGELNVAAILEGSVRREGARIRITAQLIDARTDQHIWAKTYDKTTEELFDIQAEVSQQIAAELNIRLSEDVGKRIRRKATGNLPAYDELLRSRQTTPKEAEKFLISALGKDSTFAPAWAQLAFIYIRMPDSSFGIRPTYIRKSLAAALKAIQYGPELSESHMIFGDVLKTVTLNPALSIPELQKAILLNPNNADAYVFMAHALIEMERFSEAEANLLKAGQLDPVSPQANIAWLLYYMYTRNAAVLDTFSFGLNWRGRAGRYSQADYWRYLIRDQYDSLLNLGKQNDNLMAKGIGYAKTGDVKSAKNIIDSLKRGDNFSHFYNIGILSAWLGEKDEAISYLNKAYLVYDYRLIKIRVDKHFDPLRKEEGFRELLRKMGME